LEWCNGHTGERLMTDNAQKMLLAAAGVSAAAPATGGEVNYSCRFDETDNPVLTRTVSTAGNVDKFTISFWFKIGKLPIGVGDTRTICVAGSPSTIKFNASNQFNFYPTTSSSAQLVTNQVFRDPHAWGHLVCVYDSGLPDEDADDRMRIYYNGDEITSFNTRTNPLRYENASFNSAVPHSWGDIHHPSPSGNNWDGYLAECVMIDNQALTPTSFGEFDDNKVWRPISVSTLDFGTNGFYLNFAVPTGTGNGAGTDVHLSGVTTKTTSGTGDWTGDTGDFATLATDVVATIGQTGAIYVSERTFTGDFAVEFIWYAGSHPAYVGGFATAEIGDHWSSTVALGGVNLMDDSIYLKFHFNAGNDEVDAYAAGSLDTVGGAAIFQVVYHTRETIKFQREGDTFKVFEDGVQRYEWTAKSTATYTVWLGQADSSMDWENFRWTDGSTSFLNHFTDSGLAVNDRVIDTPTNNFMTLSSLSKGYTTDTAVAGNLVWSDSTAGGDGMVGSVWITSGKWYWEVTIDALTVDSWVGVWGGFGPYASTAFSPWDSSNDIAADHGTWVIKPSTGYVIDGDGQGDPGTNATLSTFLATDVISFALDMSLGAGSNKLWIGKEGVWETSGNPDSGSGEIFANLPGGVTIVIGNRGSGPDTYTFNFGSSTAGFTYDDTIGNIVGFKAINTTNLPVPAIVDPSAHFQANTRLGTVGVGGGIPQTGNSQFGTDMIWIKNRDVNDEWKVQDRIRTAGFEWNLDSNNAQSEDINGITAFSTTDGYIMGAGTGGYNDEGEAFIDYHWKADGTNGETLDAGESDGAGGTIDISSVVAANQTAGFSMFTCTLSDSDNANNKVAHGLSSTPEFWVTKIIDAIGVNYVYHKDTTVPHSRVLYIDQNVDEEINTYLWGEVNPTSVYINFDSTGWGESENLLTYCWHSVPGFSSFGKYEGNNDEVSLDGPLIFTGFAPALVICKSIDVDNNWWAVDRARDTYNPADKEITLDLLTVGGEDADMTAPMLDFLSNGFKMRCAGAGSPNTDHTFIYMAWAENPFGGFGGTFGASSGVAPATAR